VAKGRPCGFFPAPVSAAGGREMVIAESMGGSMRARTAIVRTAHRVRLTAVGLGLMAVTACVALSACTSSPGSSPSSSVTLLSPTASATVTETSTASPTASPTVSPTDTVSPSPTPSYSPTPSPTYYYSPIPTAAPVTGGGGTAGFQDTGLAVLGTVAIVGGLGSIVYRRRITRNR
jgi:hypothetical protein